MKVEEEVTMMGFRDEDSDDNLDQEIGSSQNGQNTNKAEIRKSNKPIMEKRRRARINNCLNELKGILLEAMRKDPARHSKLEKADILELTVRHLQNIQRNQLAIAMATDPTVLHRFKNGFSECASEVGRYLGRLEGPDPAMRQRLTDHLGNCVNGLQQVGPVPAYGTVPTYGTSPMGIPYGHIHSSGPILTPTQPPPMHNTVNVMISPPHTNATGSILGDVNNNGFTGGTHISPPSATVTSLNTTRVKIDMATPPISPPIMKCPESIKSSNNLSILNSSSSTSGSDNSSLSLNSSGASLESSPSLGINNLSTPIDFSFGRRDDVRVATVEPRRFLPTRDTAGKKHESKESMWRPW